MPRYVLPLIVLIVLAVAGVYRVKGAVHNLEGELRLVEDGIADATWRIKRYETDLAYLTRPARLASLAADIGMRPASAARILDPNRLGQRRALDLARQPLAVHLRSGGEVTWRAKPVTTFTLIVDDKGEGR